MHSTWTVRRQSCSTRSSIQAPLSCCACSMGRRPRPSSSRKPRSCSRSSSRLAIADSHCCRGADSSRVRRAAEVTGPALGGDSAGSDWSAARLCPRDVGSSCRGGTEGTSGRSGKGAAGAADPSAQRRRGRDLSRHSASCARAPGGKSHYVPGVSCVKEAWRRRTLLLVVESVAGSPSTRSASRVRQIHPSRPLGGQEVQRLPVSGRVRRIRRGVGASSLSRAAREIAGL
jgi:hypothetical protein